MRWDADTQATLASSRRFRRCFYNQPLGSPQGVGFSRECIFKSESNLRGDHLPFEWRTPPAQIGRSCACVLCRWARRIGAGEAVQRLEVLDALLLLLASCIANAAQNWSRYLRFRSWKHSQKEVYLKVRLEGGMLLHTRGWPWRGNERKEKKGSEGGSSNGVYHAGRPVIMHAPDARLEVR